MCVSQRLAVLLGLTLVTSSWGFAQGVGRTNETERVELAAVASANPSATPTPDEPSPAPVPAPQARAGDRYGEAADVDPSARGRNCLGVAQV